VRTWGEPGLVALVQQNGDPSAVGVTAQQFTERWRAYLQGQYGL